MKAKNKKFIQLMYVTVTVLLLGTLLVSVAQANPLAQDPRPPVDDGGGGNGGGNGGGSGGTAGAGSGGSGSGSSTSACASLSGQVINWGFGPQEGVGIALKTGSWQTSTTSASEGQYGLGGLGVGVAKLDVSVAPALSGELEPAIEDAGVYLTCEFPTVANLAVSSAEIDPPATIEMTGPTSLTAGSSVPLRLTVENSLPNEITNVIVTDLMPPGLVALEVKAAAVDESNARIIDAGTDGQLVVVYLDKLAAGEETNIFITVTVAEEVPANTAVTNRATLFYRESVAAQSALDLTVSGSTLAIPAAVASISQDEAEAEDMAEEAFVPPDEAPTTGGELVTEAAAEENGAKEAFVAPDDMPSTGGEITVIVEPDPADTLLVDDAAPLAVEAGDISPVGKSAAAKVDITAAESPASGPSPVTFFSAMVLLVILIGLGSFRFANRRSRLADETTE